MDLEGWFSATPEAVAKHQAGVYLLAPTQDPFLFNQARGRVMCKGKACLLHQRSVLLTDLFILFRPCASLDWSRLSERISFLFLFLIDSAGNHKERSQASRLRFLTLMPC